MTEQDGKNPEKRELLQAGIVKWFKENEDAAQMLIELDLLNTSGKKTKRSGPSLRKLDYLCTTFARDKKVSYMKDGEYVNLTLEYEQAKFSWRKQNMDAFKRSDRYPFDINGTEVTTTLGQLNFFRWMFEKGAMEFAMKHIQEIEDDMKTRSSKKRKAEQETVDAVPKRKGKKRKQQSPCIIKKDKAVTLSL
jgi:hypothetical protein